MSARQYRIDSILGRGGYGVVYRATVLGNEGFEKTVALKVVESEIDDAEERLIDEARILGRLRHRAIPAVDGLVTLEDDRRALVLEFVEGEDLSWIVRHAGPVPVGPTLRVGAEIASALAFAWDAIGPNGPLHMVHRDVKPANVMVTRTGEVKLLDFGIARGRLARAAHTQTGMVVGTARFMAPEAFEGHPGPEGDVYALAVTLLRIRGVKSSTPLAFATGDAYRRQRGEMIARARMPRVEALLRGMLDRRASRRPSAAECARTLERAAESARGGSLRSWVQETIASLPAHPPQPADGVVDTVIAEWSPPTDPPVARSRSALLGLGAGLSVSVVSVGGLVGVIALALAAGGAYWWATQPLDVVRVVPRPLTNDGPPESGVGLAMGGTIAVFVADGQAGWMPVDGSAAWTPLGPGGMDFASITEDGTRVYVGGGGQIHAVERASGVTQPIVSGEIPVVSPDGRYLAYQDADGAVRARDLTGADPEVILPTGAGHGRWSVDSGTLALPDPMGLVLYRMADGTRDVLDVKPVDVAFTRDRLWLRLIHGPVDDLAWVPVAAPRQDSVHVLTTASRVEELVAAPDGPLAWTETSMTYVVSLHPVRTGVLGPRELVPVGAGWTGRNGVVMDDGRFVTSAWIQGEGVGSARLEALAASGERTTLAQVSAIKGQQVLADGSVVFWDVSRAARFLTGDSDYGGMHLVRIPPEGEAEALVKLPFADVREWALTPDGANIATVTHEGELRIDPLLGSRSGMVGVLRDVDALFGFSPDGEAVALRRGGGLVVWRPGSDPLEVWPQGGTVLDAAWLDDRRLLAVSSAGLVRVNARGGGHRMLEAVPTAARQRASIAVSPNGQWVVTDRSRVQGDVWIGTLRR